MDSRELETHALLTHLGDTLLGLELLLTAGVFGAALLLLNRRALAQPSETDYLARTLHLVSPNLTTTVGLVLTGASLAMEQAK